jgi:hypothetical protein
MIGPLNNLLEIINKLFGSSDERRKAKDASRQCSAEYLRKIATCLLTCVKELEKNEVPTASWSEFQQYAREFPKNVSKELGQDKADELTKLLTETANYKPENHITSIKAVAGELEALANQVQAETSSKQDIQNWFQQAIHWKLPLWMIVPLFLLAGYPLIRSYAEKTSEISASKESQRIFLLLPANKLWLNTGFQVKPDQKVKISATGSVNLGIHRLVEAAYTHDSPRWNWTDPEGNQESSRPTPIDKAVKQLFIEPDRKPGVLLASVIPNNNETLGKYNPKPKGIQQIGKEGEISSKEGGTLWLVVNDAVLNKNAGNAYVLPQKDLDQTYGKGKVTEEQRKEEWERIKIENYFEAFFDDNAGNFLVQIQITK